MRAAFVRSIGPDSTIEIGDLPVPSPGATEVLVQVQAMALDPVDSFIRTGVFETPVPLPFIVGRDLVGTVVSTGSPVLPFAPGDRVWCNSMGHAGRQGAAAEFVAVPADRLYSVPDGVDPEQAVALGHPAGTAYLGCFVHGRVRVGSTIYVGGGAGNIGLAAVRMATLAGARVLASARPEDHQACLSAGAAAVVDYHHPDLAEWIREQAPDGVDLFWDTSGHHDFELAQHVAAPGCRVLLTAARRFHPSIPVLDLFMLDVSLIGFVISRATTDQLADAAEFINQQLAIDGLSARITERIGLEELPDAYRRLAAGSVRGRQLALL